MVCSLQVPPTSNQMEHLWFKVELDVLGKTLWPNIVQKLQHKITDQVKVYFLVSWLLLSLISLKDKNKTKQKKHAPFLLFFLHYSLADPFLPYHLTSFLLVYEICFTNEQACSAQKSWEYTGCRQAPGYSLILVTPTNVSVSWGLKCLYFNLLLCIIRSVTYSSVSADNFIGYSLNLFFTQVGNQRTRKTKTEVMLPLLARCRSRSRQHVEQLCCGQEKPPPGLLVVPGSLRTQSSW